MDLPKAIRNSCYLARISRGDSGLTDHTEEHERMNRRTVVCPNCELHFTSAREKTYCPGCHQLVEPAPAR
ncbi:MAG: hypothetical protein IPF51_15150 [Dehalococcoidia bacterium]|uniref:hypothetical protein n=1 Tax=Candidatus Amarobacter glycogenicus TaxID=3140699 RepID=UPI003134AB29|nr:hypothetical protein [Dehalococcoidia bacterium]MBK9545168.1 hypothetical protein [Dehalococcoidia bacterium]